jgi:hypothetical protein
MTRMSNVPTTVTTSSAFAFVHFCPRPRSQLFSLSFPLIPTSQPLHPPPLRHQSRKHVSHPHHCDQSTHCSLRYKRTHSIYANFKVADAVNLGNRYIGCEMHNTTHRFACQHVHVDFSDGQNRVQSILEPSYFLVAIKRHCPTI